MHAAVYEPPRTVLEQGAIRLRTIIMDMKMKTRHDFTVQQVPRRNGMDEMSKDRV